MIAGRGFSRRRGLCAPAVSAALLTLLWSAGPGAAERLEKCPVAGADAAETGKAVTQAPSCAQAYEIMNVCRSNTKADVPLAQIVVDMCEKVLNPTLDEPKYRAYKNARDACARRFSQEKTERALSFQATCEAGVAVVFAQRADAAAIRARRDRKREEFMPPPRELEPQFEQQYPQSEPPMGDPFGGLPPR